MCWSGHLWCLPPGLWGPVRPDSGWSSWPTTWTTRLFWQPPSPTWAPTVATVTGRLLPLLCSPPRARRRLLLGAFRGPPCGAGVRNVGGAGTPVEGGVSATDERLRQNSRAHASEPARPGGREPAARARGQAGQAAGFGLGGRADWDWTRRGGNSDRRGRAGGGDRVGLHRRAALAETPSFLSRGRVARLGLFLTRVGGTPAGFPLRRGPQRRITIVPVSKAERAGFGPLTPSGEVGLLFNALTSDDVWRPGESRVAAGASPAAKASAALPGSPYAAPPTAPRGGQLSLRSSRRIRGAKTFRRSRALFNALTSSDVWRPGESRVAAGASPAAKASAALPGVPYAAPRNGASRWSTLVT